MTNVLVVVGKSTNIVTEKISNLAKNMVMKNLFLYMSIIMLSTLTLLNIDCKTPDPGPGYPTYNYIDPIVNPPDIFQVLYNISFPGDRFAQITFDSNAVWYVQKVGGDSRPMLWAVNDTTQLVIPNADTLGPEGGITYVFAANNNNYEELSNFFVQFNKLEIDYDGFEPKF